MGWAVEGVPSFRRRKQGQSLAEMEVMAKGEVSCREREDTYKGEYEGVVRNISRIVRQC